MTWRQSYDAMDRVMVHPFDNEVWKHFNSVHPHFSIESRNVRLGICTDEFNPFRSFVALYFCWPIILTIYNLSPEMYMKPKFMFLSAIISDPNSPGWNIDVCLQRLIDKLTQLLSSRTLTYDVSTKHNFLMKTALM